MKMSFTRTKSTTQLFVRSNIHMTNLNVALRKHLHLQKFVDVTLSCEGRKFKCHRLILAAASPLFENLFLDNPTQNPIVIIPFGIKPWTLQTLIEFMYKGHVNVSQCGLKDLVRGAELLQVTGLENARNEFDIYCNNDYNKNSSNNAHNVLQADNNCDNLTTPDDTNNDDDDDNNNYDDDDIGGTACEDGISNEAQCNIYKNAEKVKSRGKLRTVSPCLFLFLIVHKINLHKRCCDRREKIDICLMKNNHISTSNGVSHNIPSIGKIRVKSNEILLKHEGTTVATKYLSKQIISGNGMIDSEITNSNNTSTIDALKIKLPQNHKKLENDFLLRHLANAEKKEKIEKFTLVEQNIKEKMVNKTLQPPQQNCTTEIDIKTEEVDMTVENIICQPNVAYVYSSSVHKNDDDNVKEYNYICDPADAYVNDTTLQMSNYTNVMKDKYIKIRLDEIRNSPPSPSSFKQTEQLANMHHRYQVQENLKLKQTHKKQLFEHYKRQLHPAANETKIKQKSTERYNDFRIPSTIGTTQEIDLQQIVEPTVDTVILRSPRSNQPRNYSTQALYNALMAVKHGESIYRASREHLVPRKTLRNWMKRWNIKSQFPMPKQLKDAAIRRKINGAN